MPSNDGDGLGTQSVRNWLSAWHEAVPEEGLPQEEIDQAMSAARVRMGELIEEQVREAAAADRERQRAYERRQRREAHRRREREVPHSIDFRGFDEGFRPRYDIAVDPARVRRPRAEDAPRTPITFRAGSADMRTQSVSIMGSQFRMEDIERAMGRLGLVFSVSRDTDVEDFSYAGRMHRAPVAVRARMSFHPPDEEERGTEVDERTAADVLKYAVAAST